MKFHIRVMQRRLSDWTNRATLPIAKSKSVVDGENWFLVEQVIKHTSLFENKVHNIKLAAKNVTKISIFPGEVFSFWNAVGNPSELNGYKVGRNIVKGQIKESFGGGLCQLSGIIYHASLLAGLSITERFNHSVDIYNEENRFTPLGSDATVAYGYKDLRVKNTFDCPIRFIFLFSPEAITCGIQCSDIIHPKQLHFQRIETGTMTEVFTLDAATGVVVARSIYGRGLIGSELA